MLLVLHEAKDAGCVCDLCLPLPALTRHSLSRRQAQASPSMAAPAIRRPRVSPPTQVIRQLRAARRCPTTSTPQPPRLPTAAATRRRAPTSSRPRPRRPRSSRALQATHSRPSRRPRTPNMPCLRLRLSLPSLVLQRPLHLNPTRCLKIIRMLMHSSSGSDTREKAVCLLTLLVWNCHWFDCVSVHSRTLTVHFVLLRKVSPNQDLIGVFAPIAQASSYDTSNSYASYNQSAGFKDYQPQQQPPPQHQQAAAAAPAQPRYNAANMAPSQQPQPPAAGPHSTYNAGYGNASSAYGGTASPAPSTSAPLSGAGNQVSRLYKHSSKTAQFTGHAMRHLHWARL